MEITRYLTLLIAILICRLQKNSLAIDAPENVMVTNEGSTNSLRVTWDPPADATAHEVMWNPPDTNGTNASVGLDGAANNYTIIDLTPGTLYDVTVTAKNGTDDTMDGTGQGRTIPSPVTLMELPSTNDSISVEWSKPLGEVDQYFVSCFNGTVDPPSPIVENGSATYQASCMGLPTAGADYTITVTSESGNESSSESSLTITALPSAVTDLRESGATTNSVSVTWTKPSGVVSSYNVTCPDNTTKTVMENNTGSTYNVICDGLQTAGANYIVEVVTISGRQASDPVSVDITAYPNTVSLIANTTTTRQITVTWANPDGEEDSFLVDCGDDGSNDFTVYPANATDNTFRVTCDVPKAGADYNITVTSVSGDKNSSVTETFLAATPDQVIINNPTSDTTSITVTWSEISTADGFRVTCSEGTPSPSSSLPGNATQVTCMNVTSGGNHSVRITTLENNGESPETVTYVVAVPEAVTLREEESMVMTDSITASWDNATGVFDYYNVSCSSGTASPSLVNPSEPLRASCTGLEPPGDNYTISVTTVSNGQSSAIATITITALPSAVTLMEGPSNNTVISATWTNPGSIMDTFEITCSNGTPSPPSIDVATSPTNDDFTAYCTELPIPGLEYFLTVVAISYNKQSASRTVGVHASPASVVLMPGNSTTNTVTATWNRPESAVEHYMIECSYGDALPPTIEDTSRENYNASCVNLPTPGDTYTMTVFSFVDNGTTSTSSYIELTALPEAVTLMEERDMVTTDSITASWSNATGVFDYYEVSCSNGTASPAQVNPGVALMASCTDLETPGDNYTISVVTVVTNDDDTIYQRSATATATITAYPAIVNLTAGPITTRQITVMWADPNGEEDSYKVDCGDDGSNDLTVYPPGPFEATCNVSMAGADYDITVTSVSGDKESPVTETFTAATPDQVAGVDMSSNTTSITVTWDAIPTADGFRVNCSEGTPSPSSSLPGDATQATCDGVTPGGTHSVSIVTLENNGESPKTVAFVVAVPEAVELSEASDNVTTSSIFATWVMPNGIVEYFDVTCPVGDPSPAQVNPTNDLIASCVNLTKPGDDYNISVTAVSGGQRSMPDTITITALPEAVDLTEGASNTTVISATWTVPNSMVDNFAITCSNGTASPSFIDSFQAGDELTAYCTHLPTSGEEYDLTVVAISKEKLSAPRTVSVFALPLGVDLQEGPSTTTSVSATWLRQNDTVESYSISCSHGDASPPTIVDTNQESYSASCVNLPGPGATYSMTVYSEVGTDTTSNSTRASSFIQLVSEPQSVENISIANYTTTTVSVQWQLKTCSACVYNYFILTFEPDRQDPITVDYTSGTDEYSTLVSGLTQGRNYNFTVVSVSGVGVSGASLKMSKEQSVEQRTVPESTSEVNVTSGKTFLSLSWPKADGDADNYTISVNPPHGTATFNNDLETPLGEVIGLTPGTTYDVFVVTVSGAEISEPQNVTQRTLPDIPSLVQNPIAEVLGKNTIRLTYEAPAEPNGDIIYYTISYIGTRENNADHEFEFKYRDVLTVTFDDLYPGFSYTFTIIAENDGGFMSDPVSTDPVVTEEEAPEDVREDYSYVNNTIVEDTGTATITVVLPEDLFSHDNGQLLTYSVIITTDQSDSSIRSTNLTYTQAGDMRSGGITPAYITKDSVPYPFPPSFGSRRRRRATEDATVIVGEDGSCSATTSDYCNGQLNDDTQYYYAFRAYNNRGAVTSGVFGPVKTNKKTNVGGIVGGVIGALCGVFVVFVAVVVVKKRRDNENSPRPSIEGSDNPGFVGPTDGHPMNPLRRKTDSSMHRKSNSKPVLLNNFEGHYKRMKADSDLRFTEEYDEIRLVGKDQPIVAALEMVNRAKNRFTNILPYEHSRVKLAALADEPDTDYINANYMPGYNSPREFIACQGPLPGTLDDMWRMIWEKNTSIIVMLTQLVEKGKIKCHQYWPENYDPVTYGSIEVSIQGEQQYENWVIREFTIVKGEEIRKITQFHFMKWPDHGVPSQTWTMLDFVRTVRETIQKQGNDHPVLAHCSAGVGRTGTYIALDRLMQAMQENDNVDIFGVVCEMRLQRNHMVQTEKQYIFIHDCVMDLLQREDDTGESIYVNLSSNGFNHEDVNDNLLDQAV